MRRRGCAGALLLALMLLLLSACGGQADETCLLLYYTPVTVEGGAVLVGEESALPAEDATVETLMAALLAGPTDPELQSPIPAGVELLGYAVEDACLTVDLSERYGGLTDVSLTLADYAITLTLCQLPGIESVRITAAGRPVSGRALQELRPGDLVLDGAPTKD